MVQEDRLGEVLVICGPTGSGKTALAIELAKRLDSEIISADSIAVYKELNVGTAKPTKDEQLQVKHHLIDVVDPKNTFTVSDYESMALPIVKSLIAKGKIPIICGGTGFYIKSLLYDFSYGDCAKNDDVRDKFENLAKKFGNEYVYNILMEKDSVTAQKLHPNDLKRVIRALEIFFSTGKQKSQIVDVNNQRFKFSAFSFDYPRNELYNRINHRVDKMFANGLVDELKSLTSSGLNKTHQSMQGIGYKEFLEFDNILDNVEQIKELIKLNSRRYAKRQITFFKKLENVEFLSNTELSFAVNHILKKINK